MSDLVTRLNEHADCFIHQRSYTGNLLREAADRLEKLEEAIATATEMWARETTGIGGKLDRFACLERFKEQARALRKSEKK